MRCLRVECMAIVRYVDFKKYQVFVMQRIVSHSFLHEIVILSWRNHRL